jgi:hypothetical protein
VGDISLQTVMTHAEAASNRDGIWMHDNYGPVIWGGSGERWDFLQLSKGGPPTGGDELRARIRRFMAEPDATARLAFRRATSISARGQELAVELLARYDIPYEWDANRRRILIGSLGGLAAVRDHPPERQRAGDLEPQAFDTLETGITTEHHGLRAQLQAVAHGRHTSWWPAPQRLD